ncbi:MAG: ribbon-helix-helix domain-containing protein [Thermoplasmata archaeon]
MEKKISLRVSEEDLDVIDSFISGRDFPNRSAFIREAALDYIKRQTVLEDHTEIPTRISLPKRIKNTIHYLIAIGHYENWESAIKDLVKKAVLSEDINELKQKYEVLGGLSGHVESIIEVQKQQDRKYMTK